MKTPIFSGKLLFAVAKASALVIMAVSAAAFPLWGAEPGENADRNTPATVNLIIDGSQALSAALSEVEAWVSDKVIDGMLKPGDRLTIWSAGTSSKVLYSDTLKSMDDKENIKKIIQSLAGSGESADFAGALRDAASRTTGQINYTLLISASAAGLSPTLQGSAAGLIRFSRVEEFRGWRVMVVALDIEPKVRQSAGSFLSGS